MRGSPVHEDVNRATGRPKGCSLRLQLVSWGLKGNRVSRHCHDFLGAEQSNGRTGKLRVATAKGGRIEADQGKYRW